MALDQIDLLSHKNIHIEARTAQPGHDIFTGKSRIWIYNLNAITNTGPGWSKV